MCRCFVEWLPWFKGIMYLSYFPPSEELRCLLVEDLTVLYPCVELDASSWISCMLTHGYLGSLLVEILVASSLPPR